MTGPATREIDSLTALRGVGAALVLLSHTSHAGTFLRGYLGVDLFFMLSGFILMHAYGAAFHDGVHGPRYRDFLFARLSRIYPLHLLTILLLLPFFGQGTRFSVVSLVHNLLLTQGPWNPAGLSWNAAAWSLSVEWHAYLVFPFLAMFLSRQANRDRLILAALCLLVVEGLVLYLGTVAVVSSFLVLVHGLPEFLLGAILYLFFADDRIARYIEGDIAIAAVGAALVLAELFWPSDFPFLLLFPALLLTCAANRGRAAAMLRSRPLQFLGRISFSLYMIELVVRTYLDRYGAWSDGSILYAALFVTASIMVAIPLSRYVEYPARDWLRAWRRGRRIAAAPTAPTAVPVLAPVE